MVFSVRYLLVFSAKFFRESIPCSQLAVGLSLEAIYTSEPKTATPLFSTSADSLRELASVLSVVLGESCFLICSSIDSDIFDRPLYNAELAAPELRGFLVSFYQFATILGIMSSFWVGYGCNYIGGTGDGQSDLAWRLPSIIQGIPAVFLACGIWFMPFSPRWLVKVGRLEEARKTLAWLRKLPENDDLVAAEFLEIQAEAEFERRAFAKSFPTLAAKQKKNIWMHELAQYANCFRTWDNFKRVSTAWLIMFFQQWSGIDASMCTFS